MELTTLQVVRLVLVACTLAGLTFVALRTHTVLGTFRKYFGHRSYALTLGVVRIVLFLQLYKAGTRIPVASLVKLPEGVRQLPPGWGWLGEIIPLFDGELASGVQWLFVVAALLAIIGAATRVSAVIAALLAVYLVGLPNFFAKINHGEHLLVCFCLVLAFSRSGDALSVDALAAGLRRRRFSLARSSGVSRAYALPIRFCWLLMGCGYFFPGLYKAWNAGDRWLDGTALKAITLGKLASQPDFSPSIVIYDSDTLLAAFGTATLALELGFIFMMLSRRLRWVAVVAALAFHVGIAYSTGIRPWAIVRVYWIFLDTGALLLLFRGKLPTKLLEVLGLTERVKEPAAERPEAPLGTPATVGGLLVGLMLFTGMAGIDTFPVAVFPRFDGRMNPQAALRSSRYVLAIQRSGEAPRDVVDKQLPRGVQRVRWHRILRVLGGARGERRRSQFRIVTRLLRQGKNRLEPGDRLLLDIERIRFDPESHRRVVTSRKTAAKYEIP